MDFQTLPTRRFDVDQKKLIWFCVPRHCDLRRRCRNHRIATKSIGIPIASKIFSFFLLRHRQRKPVTCHYVCHRIFDWIPIKRNLDFIRFLCFFFLQFSSHERNARRRRRNWYEMNEKKVKCPPMANIGILWCCCRGRCFATIVYKSLFSYSTVFHAINT